MKRGDDDLHERGIELISRLISLADKLTDTAAELRLVADTLRPAQEEGSSNAG